MIVTPGQLSRRAELYQQLGAMLSAGVPLIKALEMAQSNSAIRTSRGTISQLIFHLNSGLTFSESMTRVHGWMPEFDIALLSVGEQSGRLDVSFRQLAHYYSARARIIRDSIAGLVTTLATLHVFLLLFPLGYFTDFVLGIFNNNYAACVPFLIQKAVIFGIGYGVVFAILFASQSQRSHRWRAILERLSSGIPILRTARKYLVLARLSASLEALTSAGVSIVEGWRLASEASGSPRLRGIVSDWKRLMDSGVTPGELVNRASYFPEMFANLYNTGEQSGQLDETLGRLQSYYEEEGFRKLKLFSRVLNGTIYGLVVLAVAINVIGAYVARFNAIVDSF